MIDHFRLLLRLVRAAGVLLVTAVGEVGWGTLAADAVNGLRAVPNQASADLAAAFGDVAVLMALLAWTWVLMLVVSTVIEVLAHPVRTVAFVPVSRFAPPAARRAALAVLGLGVMVASAGTMAAGSVGPDSPSRAAAAGVRCGVAESAHRIGLDGLPLPDRPSTGRRPTAPRDHKQHHVTVRPGDTLWSIAAMALGGRAPMAAIARSWPRWYAANQAAIGDDPDFLLPGTVLETPVPKRRTAQTLPPDEGP